MIENPLIANPGMRGGANVSLTVNHLGVSASARNVGQRFSGYFGIALNPQYCTLNAGTVTSVATAGKSGPVTPTIGGVPIGGSQTQGTPKLALSSDTVDATLGVSYVTLEVVPTTAGVLDSAAANAASSVARVVHLGAIEGAPAGTYRAVIGVIQWRNGSPYKVFQTLYFNVKFMLYTPPAGNGPAVGFFFPG